MSIFDFFFGIQIVTLAALHPLLSGTTPHTHTPDSGNPGSAEEGIMADGDAQALPSFQFVSYTSLSSVLNPLRVAHVLMPKPRCCSLFPET